MSPLRVVVSSLLLLLFHTAVDGFDITSTSYPETFKPGSTIRLSCKADDDYEYCIWRHSSHVCEFEWKRSDWAVKRQRCSPYFGTRTRFTGHYEGHECTIEVRDARAEDAGSWSCEIESYVYGVGRGYVEKRSMVLVAEDETKTKEESTTVIPTTTPKDDIEFPTYHPTVKPDPASIDTALQYDDSQESPSIPHHTEDSTATATNDEAFVRIAEEKAVSEDDGSDRHETSSYVGVIVGTFFGLFAVMVVLAFLGYRHHRRHRKQAEWEGIRNGEKRSGSDAVPNENFIMAESAMDKEYNRVPYWWQQHSQVELQHAAAMT